MWQLTVTIFFVVTHNSFNIIQQPFWRHNAGAARSRATGDQVTRRHAQSARRLLRMLISHHELIEVMSAPPPPPPELGPELPRLLLSLQHCWASVESPNPVHSGKLHDDIVKCILWVCFILFPVFGQSWNLLLLSAELFRIRPWPLA